MQPVILAGGRSKRFGQEKALFKWRERAFIDHIISTLTQVFDGPEVWLSVDHIGNRAKLVSHLGRYDNLVFVEDGPGDISGPLAGVSATLEYAARSSVEWCFLVACDMPAVRPLLIHRLTELARKEGPERHSAVVPRPLIGGLSRYQPLHACYRVEVCLERLKVYANSGGRSLQGFVESLPNPTIVEVNELDGMDPLWKQALVNINDVQELSALEELPC